MIVSILVVGTVVVTTASEGIPDDVRHVEENDEVRRGGGSLAVISPVDNAHRRRIKERILDVLERSNPSGEGKYHARRRIAGNPARQRLGGGIPKNLLGNNGPVHGSGQGTNSTIWALECHSRPILLCSTCDKGVIQEEQDWVIRSLRGQLADPSSIFDVILTTQKIFNGVFVRVSDSEDFLSMVKNVQNHVDGLGIKKVWPHQERPVVNPISRPTGQRKLLRQQQHERRNGVDFKTDGNSGRRIQQSTCTSWTGRGIVIGVLDTGIDYTHADFGGPGTVESYIDAYGVDQDDTRNTQRDDYFPTTKVVDGYDFVGETEEDVSDPTEFMDDDPIDGSGHGTAVASAILKIAPDVTLVAAKACRIKTTVCPDYALVAAIEYLLDPNEDGDMEDRVDIINLSLGNPYNRPQSDVVSAMLEAVVELGVVVVTSFGNSGNIPYNSGAVGTSPNLISVGATSDEEPAMEWYSSRGPGVNNVIKPDISAPSNSLVAVRGTGTAYESMAGTSFSAPLVSGAAARILEKCSKKCSPFAVKAILMNNANPDIMYSTEKGEDRLAPITRMGSGQYDVGRALDAAFWAYSVEDVQPAINLGIFVDNDQDITVQRTIRITNLIPGNSTKLLLLATLRDPNKAKSGAVTISFDSEEVELGSSSCLDSFDVQVAFSINASLVQPNVLSSTGENGTDPVALDHHEYGGHITITSSGTSKQISLPFLLLLRQSSRLRFMEGTSLPSTYGPVDTNLTIVNEGAGIAQIDAYELLISDQDNEEPPFGAAVVSADVRTVGYRILPVNDSGCDRLVEFSFALWERVSTASEVTLGVDIYRANEQVPLTLWMPSAPLSTDAVLIHPNKTLQCTGFRSDHGSNTGNIVIRACSNDLLLMDDTTIEIQAWSGAYPMVISEIWSSIRVPLPYPTPRLRAHSYDIAPGETLSTFHVTGEIDRFTAGLQLITNAYRNSNHSGASTRETESLLVLREGIVVEQEVTKDILVPFPVTQDFSGPDCDWLTKSPTLCQADSESNVEVAASTRSAPLYMDDVVRPQQESVDEEFPEDDFTDCPPVEVPRMTVPTHGPTETPTMNPTGPTLTPTETPTTALPSPIELPTTAIPSQSAATPTGTDFYSTAEPVADGTGAPIAGAAAPSESMDGVPTPGPATSSPMPQASTSPSVGRRVANAGIPLAMVVLVGNLNAFG